jgi:hypothetical protein
MHNYTQLYFPMAKNRYSGCLVFEVEIVVVKRNHLLDFALKDQTKLVRNLNPKCGWDRLRHLTVHALVVLQFFFCFLFLMKGIFGAIATRRMRRRLNWESPGIREVILAGFCRGFEKVLTEILE